MFVICAWVHNRAHKCTQVHLYILAHVGARGRFLLTLYLVVRKVSLKLELVSSELQHPPVLTSLGSQARSRTQI